MTQQTLRVSKEVKITQSSMTFSRIKMKSIPIEHKSVKDGKFNLIIVYFISEKKYEALRKNVNLNLCYLYLMTYDYVNAIKTGNSILRGQNPNAKTRF
jgi:hypothetical protein